MSFYPLCNYDQNKWHAIKEILSQTKINRTLDLVDLLSNFILIDFNIRSEIEISLNYLMQFNSEDTLVKLFNRIIEFCFQLELLFPNGKLIRITTENRLVELNRCQILCILCHMFLCTLEISKTTLYWVNFEIWFNISTKCTRSYLQSLIEYFKESFFLFETNPNYMKEIILFEKKFIAETSFCQILNKPTKLSSMNLKLNGSIGDNGNCEVDFANMDIGYGKTGTQEEILFASSPEMCVAMLFTETIKDEEAVIIKGARKIAKFEGYGLDVNFVKTVEFESKNWKDRVVIAIDALDFSFYCDESFKVQLERKNLMRELKKSFVGFSSINNSIIETGHWGCGCFNGNMYLKAIVQLIASSFSNNAINYYCFQNLEFYQNFSNFIVFLEKKQATSNQLLDFILTNKFEESNFLETLCTQFSSCEKF